MFVRRARTYRAYIPLALAAVLSVMTAAVAQQATDDQPATKAKPAKQKSAAPKTSEKKSETKSEAKSETKSAPTRKANGVPATTSAVPAPGGGQPTPLGQYGH